MHDIDRVVTAADPEVGRGHGAARGRARCRARALQRKNVHH
jgi:hypothetical protein